MILELLITELIGDSKGLVLAELLANEEEGPRFGEIIKDEVGPMVGWLLATALVVDGLGLEPGRLMIVKDDAGEPMVGWLLVGLDPGRLLMIVDDEVGPKVG